LDIDMGEQATVSIAAVLTRLSRGESLSRSEAAEALRAVMSGAVTEIQTAALLTALRTKGETVDEVTGFVETMRAHARRVELHPDSRPVVDTCGTGGDGFGTFNVSTTAAFVVAGAAVRVAKHGNRAATSLSGSADLLEALGAAIASPPHHVAASINRFGFGFMLAPEYHPAMKYVMPVRRALGFPTVFNILGPLSNPAGVRRQVIGVRDRDTARMVAGVLGQLGSERAIVVTSAEGADELTLTGANYVVDYDVERSGIVEYQVDAREYGLPASGLAEIKGGSAADNALLTKRVLDGEDGPHRHTVVLNAAAALIAAGAAVAMGEAVEMAQQAIDSGAARSVLAEYVAFSNAPATEVPA
jgi:anthranilate phosphoribosyltransferase